MVSDVYGPVMDNWKITVHPQESVVRTICDSFENLETSHEDHYLSVL